MPRRRVLAGLWLAAALCCAGAAGAAEGCAPARFRVALDVGHTVAQPGATSARGGTEFGFNQRLATAVAAALTRAGVAYVVIGGDGGPLPLLDRTRRAAAAGAGLFLSLHHDSVQPQYLLSWTVDGRVQRYSDRFRGYSIFVSADNPRLAESQRFATLLGQGLRAAGFIPSLHHAEPIPGEGRPLLDAYLGLYRFDGLAVLRTASMPAALLEAGVIVNRAEEEALQSPAGVERMAAAVAGAVQRYCGGP